MRVVTLDAPHRRHVGTKVDVGKFPIRFVAHQAEPRHRSGELERFGTPVGIVAGGAVFGGGCVSAVCFYQRFHISVAGKAQFGPGCAE